MNLTDDDSTPVCKISLPKLLETSNLFLLHPWQHSPTLQMVMNAIADQRFFETPVIKKILVRRSTPSELPI